MVKLKFGDIYCSTISAKIAQERHTMAPNYAQKQQKIAKFAPPRIHHSNGRFTKSRGKLGLGFVGWVTTGHLRPGAIIRVETKAPLDMGGCGGRGCPGSSDIFGHGTEGGRRGNNEDR